MAHHVPVTVDDSHDPLNRMRAHQIAETLIEDAFADATKLKAEIITVEIAPQLYASICGIEANIGEAYSRSSGKGSSSQIRVCPWRTSREHELVQGSEAGARRGNNKGSPKPTRRDTPSAARDHPPRARQDNEIARSRPKSSISLVRN